jgi:hypothetical protein
VASIRRRRGRVEVKLDEDERRVLLGIVDSLTEVLGTVPRTSPRAFDDPKLEAEYQRWIAPELADARGADIDTVRRALGSDEEHCELDDAQALAWVRALNHLRLAAGGLLGIEDDGWEEAVPTGEHGRDEYRMLSALGWVQEALVDALDS